MEKVKILQKLDVSEKKKRLWDVEFAMKLSGQNVLALIAPISPF